ncbi:hypothetical protein [Chitinophaga sp. XS-30]|uniref:hypothetical protein n=1 Tax=Chitinophaga sp. XS-30 TaxID=2604421 RepID=UPI0011DCBCC2|nr:hypothetical protein [Chitinophaga sp. XS-30]QEH41872.1 hypothetical protein FW415_13690 [Chitinophaga sp. XS-30]
MKRSQSFLYFLILLLIALLVYAWFFRRIPVNDEVAKAHVISMDEAAGYTHAFANAKMQLARQLQDTGYLNREFNLPVCEMFNKDAIAALLNQQGATGIRIYLGLNEKKEVCFVIVPTSGEGKDIRSRLVSDNGFSIPGISKAMAQANEFEQALERGIRCPHMCDLESPLSLP